MMQPIGVNTVYYDAESREDAVGAAKVRNDAQKYSKYFYQSQSKQPQN